MSLALSTSWNATRAHNAKELLFEIKELGFKEVELSFNLPSEIVLGIKKALKDSGLKARSLHNYCPIPEGLTPEVALPDCFSMSSLDESERADALKYTLKTIDLAHDIGAEAVVLHCGRVETPDRTRELIKLFDTGLKDSAEFKKLKSSAEAERSAGCKQHLEQALKSLCVLNSAAREKNIRLGVETRYYFNEIPGPNEIGLILNEFKGSQVYYWHDVGHAEVMERLGFYSHREFLKLYSGSMLGIHLHDISGCRDHKAPGQGDLDFAKIRPFLNKDCLKVMEAHRPATGEDLKKSKILLEEIFNGLI